MRFSTASTAMRRGSGGSSCRHGSPCSRCDIAEAGWYSGLIWPHLCACSLTAVDALRRSASALDHRKGDLAGGAGLQKRLARPLSQRAAELPNEANFLLRYQLACFQHRGGRPSALTRGRTQLWAKPDRPMQQEPTRNDLSPHQQHPTSRCRQPQQVPAQAAMQPPNQSTPRHIINRQHASRNSPPPRETLSAMSILQSPSARALFAFSQQGPFKSNACTHLPIRNESHARIFQGLNDFFDRFASSP